MDPDIPLISGMPAVGAAGTNHVLLIANTRWFRCQDLRRQRLTWDRHCVPVRYGNLRATAVLGRHPQARTALDDRGGQRWWQGRTGSGAAGCTAGCTGADTAGTDAAGTGTVWLTAWRCGASSSTTLTPATAAATATAANRAAIVALMYQRIDRANCMQKALPWPGNQFAGSASSSHCRTRRSSCPARALPARKLGAPRLSYVVRAAAGRSADGSGAFDEIPGVMLVDCPLVVGHLGLLDLIDPAKLFGHDVH